MRHDGPPLKGVFAKTHLVTMLQMFKKGPPIPMEGRGTDIMTPRPEIDDPELHVALKEGLMMMECPHDIVSRFAKSFESLMVMDNADNADGLTESSIRCVHTIHGLLRALEVERSRGKRCSDITNKIAKRVEEVAAAKWSTEEIKVMIEFARAQTAQHVDLMFQLWESFNLDPPRKCSFFLSRSMWHFAF